MTDPITPAKETTAAAPAAGAAPAPATTEPKTDPTPAAPATGEPKTTEPAKAGEGKPASYLEGTKTDPEKKPETAPEGDAPTFKLPEGVAADDPRVAAFGTTAKELKLSADQAQKLVDSFVAADAAKNKAAAEAWAKQQLENRKALEAHPDIGGANLEKSQAEARKAIAFLNQTHGGLGNRVVEKLTQLGLGDDPDLAHFLTLAGRSMAEDKVGNTSKSPGQMTDEERLQRRYPSLKITGGAK